MAPVQRASLISEPVPGLPWSVFWAVPWPRSIYSGPRLKEFRSTNWPWSSRAYQALQLENNAVIAPRIGSIDNPPRYQSIRYKINIGSPEPKEKIEELEKAVESICPVYNLLKDSQPIKGAVIRGPFVEKAK